LKYQQRAEH